MSRTDQLGIAALIAAVSFAAGVFWSHDQIYIAGFSDGHVVTETDALIRARLSVEAEMRRACTCWFDDSRCRAKHPVVVCVAPSFYNKPGV